MFQRAEKIFRKITDFYIMFLDLEKPGLAIISEVRTTLSVEVTESAVCKFLKKAGFM